MDTHTLPLPLRQMSRETSVSLPREAHPHNDDKQRTVAEGRKQSLGFLTHLGNTELIKLEATQRHRSSKADFQLGGNIEAARGKERRKRRETRGNERVHQAGQTCGQTHDLLGDKTSPLI
ncbi:hypothetical protein PAMP_014635 [Pampus punctatissimus]